VYDLETSRIGAPYIYIYIYDVSNLRVKRRIHRMLSFLVDNGVRSTQISNKKEKESEKKWDVNLNLKGFISRMKKKRYIFTHSLHFSPVRQKFVC